MNNGFLSWFIVINVFWENKWISVQIVLKTKYIFLALGMWECSSVVERSTADREVAGSFRLTPFFIRKALDRIE